MVCRILPPNPVLDPILSMPIVRALFNKTLKNGHVSCSTRLTVVSHGKGEERGVSFIRPKVASSIPRRYKGRNLRRWGLKRWAHRLELLITLFWPPSFLAYISFHSFSWAIWQHLRHFVAALLIILASKKWLSSNALILSRFILRLE